jgi:hypothetical protein
VDEGMYGEACHRVRVNWGGEKPFLKQGLDLVIMLRLMIRPTPAFSGVRSKNAEYDDAASELGTYEIRDA